MSILLYKLHGRICRRVTYNLLRVKTSLLLEMVGLTLLEILPSIAHTALWTQTLEVVDVREVGGKSPNMVKLGLERGMDRLTQKANVVEVVTDAQTEILAIMKNSGKFDNISHQIDVWHGAKNIIKKMSNVANAKGNEDLQLWIPAIRNHFWFSCRSCSGDTMKLKAICLSLLQHVVNEHEWVLSLDGSVGKCRHEELTQADRNKPWLQKGSKAHQALQGVMRKKRFLNTLKYYKDFRHTGNLNLSTTIC
ncbi:hypothetical protein HOLleu_16995 [Holothuria leucospilota]|uniref:Uncharacterized protein n=1 Tax=Holothuria leucospilota TaxID=206669 RepID=A0A9Q1C7L9_HOLLE|nr:hypothetical protein HOLleu_16995 [Holothuria leucospilota]